MTPPSLPFLPTPEQIAAIRADHPPRTRPRPCGNCGRPLGKHAPGCFHAAVGPRPQIVPGPVAVGERARWVSDKPWGGRWITFEGVVRAVVPRGRSVRDYMPEGASRGAESRFGSGSWDRYLVQADDGRWLAPKQSRVGPASPPPARGFEALKELARKEGRIP